MAGCLSPEDNQDEGWKKCEETIARAIIKQINDSGEPPRLVDAIPTLGKTTAAGTLAPDICSLPEVEGFTYLTHLRRNRHEFRDNLQQEIPDDSPLEFEQLPVLSEDCPTAAGAHGSEAEDKMDSLYSRGIAPGALHTDDRLDFPCGGKECPYMRKWRGILDADILIGHPTHAYETGVVEDRIVVIDEGVGGAFETKFPSKKWRRAIGEYLSYQDDIPVNSITDILNLRKGRHIGNQENVASTVRSIEQSDLYGHLIDSNRGHVNTLYALWALVEPISVESGEPPYKIELQNGIEFAELTENTVAVFDPESGIITVRRTPDFEMATSLVGLDGTPTKSMWSGRLGIDNLEIERVLCETCRETYLDEILGYDIIQTSPYRKPYSSVEGNRISFEKDRGLLHEVCQQSAGDVGLITTRRAKEPLLEHEDQNVVDIKRFNTDHYGNIRSSNRFEGSEVEVGVVLGSPHPGSDTLRRIAGLDGVPYESQSVPTSLDGHHYRQQQATRGKRYLEHYREHKVAQAVFRFGREDGATVFVHTSALPDWMKEIAEQGEVEKRSKGELTVWEELQATSQGTTADFDDKIEQLGTSRIREVLDQFAEEGIVKKGGSSHRIIWEKNDSVEHLSTAQVRWPDE